jgi:hypothetical protein
MIHNEGLHISAGSIEPLQVNSCIGIILNLRL